MMAIKGTTVGQKGHIEMNRDRSDRIGRETLVKAIKEGTSVVSGVKIRGRDGTGAAKIDLHRPGLTVAQKGDPTAPIEMLAQIMVRAGIKVETTKVWKMRCFGRFQPTPTGPRQKRSASE